MTGIKVIIREESSEAMATMALTYVMDNWEDFVIEMGLESGPDGKEGVAEMRDELAHHTAEMLHDNKNILRLLITVWGQERVEAFIDNLCSCKD